MFDQKLSKLAHLLHIFHACKFKKRDFNIWIHIHLIGMAMVLIMLIKPPAITHADQEVSSHQAQKIMFP
ncbi:hypothetical protein KSC_099690 [Ktedonobacter sp. SOSP1-52]|nr:hypothetical protein KSC_099690 [Ktedonobacter sp. SOSP1-52]